MASRCHGLCDGEASADGITYSEGWKRCTTCYIKVKTEDVRCPCCKFPYRTIRRKTKNSKRIVKRI